MEGKVDIEKLIIEVQARPALWDMSQGDYSDRIKRKECWDEIANIFGQGNATTDEKNLLRDLLHKKWKNIRDRYAREIQDSKGMTASGARKKAPYIYAQQLLFLKDTLMVKKLVNSLEQASNEKPSVAEESHDAGPSTSTTEKVRTGRKRPYPVEENVQITQINKKKLHPIEEKILRSLERHEKRANLMQEDDNRHFLLSLLPGLASLPRRVNTNCRIELMQCISKYETHDEGQQQILAETNGFKDTSSIESLNLMSGGADDSLFSEDAIAVDSIKQDPMDCHVDPGDTNELGNDDTSIRNYFKTVALTVDSFPLEYQEQIKVMLLQQVSEIQMQLADLPSEEFSLSNSSIVVKDEELTE